MKKNDLRVNPYATNKGGKIQSLNNPAANDPRATVTKGDDLRRK